MELLRILLPDRELFSRQFSQRDMAVVRARSSRCGKEPLLNEYELLNKIILYELKKYLPSFRQTLALRRVP
jgi:hypothetical protein